MKVVIQQPSVLPYHGFFKLMKEADKFVFLDNVQFSKQSWQQRNKVLINGKEVWLSIPVFQGSGQLLKDVEIADIYKADKIRKTAEQSFGVELPYITPKLCETNNGWIEYIAGKLNIHPKLVMASDLGTSDIVDICKHLKADKYISTGGSQVYFDQPLFERFANIDCEVKFIHFEPDYSLVQYMYDNDYLKRRELL